MVQAGGQPEARMSVVCTGSSRESLAGVKNLGRNGVRYIRWAKCWRLGMLKHRVPAGT